MALLASNGGAALLLRAVLLLTLLLCAEATGVAHERPSRKEQLEAAFFYRFLRYLSWQRPASTIRYEYCVIGHDGLHELVAELIQREDDAAQVRSVQNVSEAETCALLFIGSGAAQELPQILAAVSDAPTVTVSDLPGFADRGGMIEFVVEDQHLRFIINQITAEERGVQISSQLLALAKERIG